MTTTDMFDQVKIGIAPIGWTNDDDPDLGGDISFEQCIQEMHEAGYEGCEIGNKFPRDPQKLHAALDPLHLQVASQWFSAYFTIPERVKETVDQFIEHMNFLKAMGASVIVVCECGYAICCNDVPLFNNKPVFNDKQWQNLVIGLHQIGKLARDNDMHLVYHEHMGTGIQTEEELDLLMEKTDPQLVSLLLDTGHLTLAEGDPISSIHKHGKRIKHVHLKDLRQEKIAQAKQNKWNFLQCIREGIFTVPGDGFIDYAPIFTLLAQQQYRGWFIVEAEQDPKVAHPLTYAKKGRAFIKKLTGL